jgi:hypothetical protein
MAKGDPPTSPWMFYDSGGDYLGRKITGTVTFDGTNTLTGGTVTRDAGCVYTKVIIGPLNLDGTPSAQAKVIDMSGFEGSRTFTKAQLNSAGLFTVSDILGTQITASP